MEKIISLFASPATAVDIHIHRQSAAVGHLRRHTLGAQGSCLCPPHTPRR